MTLVPTDPVALTQALIRCESVTPDEGGALTLLQNVLEPAGFTCHRLVFSEPGTPDVDNLYARLGSGRPHLSFAGHTDVVPVGNDAGLDRAAVSGRHPRRPALWPRRRRYEGVHRGVRRGGTEIHPSLQRPAARLAVVPDHGR